MFTLPTDKHTLYHRCPIWLSTCESSKTSVTSQNSVHLNCESVVAILHYIQLALFHSHWVIISQAGSIRLQADATDHVFTCWPQSIDNLQIKLTFTEKLSKPHQFVTVTEGHQTHPRSHLHSKQTHVTSYNIYISSYRYLSMIITMWSCTLPGKHRKVNHSYDITVKLSYVSVAVT